jgi:hypothetical protein
MKMMGTIPRVAAIIPAFNEAKTIGDVVAVVRRSPLVDEIIVVSDGSTDETATVARRAGARVVVLEENVGKGGAIAAGLRETGAEVILLLDADLVGLTTQHIASLLLPVLTGEVGMTIGQHEQDLIQEIFPQFSGQRALRRELLEAIPDLGETGFGVEAVLTRYAKVQGVRFRTVPLQDLTHVPKQEKHGFVRGVAAKLKATWEIAKWTNKVNVG